MRAVAELARLALFGAMAAIPVALLWAYDGTSALWRHGTILEMAALRAFAQAAGPEELVKAIALFMILRQIPALAAHGAAVRGAAFGFGFAAVESVLYAAHDGVDVTVVRAFTAVPCHVFLGAVMAHYLARSLATRQLSALIKAFLIPCLCHGLYDFPLMVEVKGDPHDGLMSLVLAGLVLALLAAWTRVLLTSGRSALSARPRLP